MLRFLLMIDLIIFQGKDLLTEMGQSIKKLMIILFLCQLLASLNLQTAEDIDQTQSILELNKCKTECLQMKEYFPFQFRYHRLIIRQSVGMVKYFVGHCQVKMLGENFEQWQNLKRYIESTNLFGDSDVLNKGQASIWSSYNEACQSSKLKLNQQVIESLNLSRHHSNFYYYDDGTFKNDQPFDDLNNMWASINSKV